MLSRFPRKRNCRARDDSGLHQEEEDPVFHLPLFPTLQESFGETSDWNVQPPASREVGFSPNPSLGLRLNSWNYAQPLPPSHKPPARETHSAKRNLFKDGSHK